MTDFEWDDKKRARNLATHKVDFRIVSQMFDGDIVEIVDDRLDYGETRIRCLGEIKGRVYMVIYTWRGSNRRIISARKANEREIQIYNARHG
jgi:uncharacterized protein